MTPADEGRFCAGCHKVVIDLTAMTEQQAERRLNEARQAANAGRANQLVSVSMLAERNGRE